MAGPRSRNNTSDALLSTSKSTGPNQASSAKRRRLLSHHLNPKDILEISILSDLSHPNIVRLNHVFDDPEDDDLHIGKQINWELSREFMMMTWPAVHTL